MATVLQRRTRPETVPAIRNRILLQTDSVRRRHRQLGKSGTNTPGTKWKALVNTRPGATTKEQPT
jgi:hypothetical protein